MTRAARTMPRHGITPTGPAHLGNLFAWFDASQITGLVDADPVGTWPDASGNGHALTATLTERPFYKAAIFGSLPSVRTDGINDKIAVAGFTLAQPNTVFLVGKFVSVAGSAFRSIFDTTSGVARNTILTTNDANKFLEMYAGTVLASAVTADTNAHVLAATYNGASSGLRKNGTSIASGSANTQSLGGIRLGADSAGTGSFANYDYAEVLVYNRLLSAGEVSLVEHLLGTKWGVTIP